MSIIEPNTNYDNIAWVTKKDETNAWIYCIVGYEVCTTKNINEYQFDFFKNEYIMIGKQLDYGTDIINLDEVMILELKYLYDIKEYKIIQVIKQCSSELPNNELTYLPNVLLKPQIYYGLKDANYTMNVDMLRERYDYIPF
jgi:hypothetical protein